MAISGSGTQAELRTIGSAADLAAFTGSTSYAIRTKVSGTWKDVDNVLVNINGTWKEISKAYVKVSGVWKEV